MNQVRSAKDFVLFFRVMSFVAATPLLLQLKLSRLEMVLQDRRATKRIESATVRKIILYTDILLKLGRPLLRSTCMNRGLALCYFLRRAGLEVSLCFGIGNVRGELAGHCWLLRNGKPFLEKNDPRAVFTQIYAIPRQS